MYGQNLEGDRHQRADGDVTVATVGKLRPVWVAPMASQSTPVVAGTCVYTIESATQTSTTLNALDLDTGQIVWQTPLPPGIAGGVSNLTAGQAGAVAVVEGRVHISQWASGSDDVPSGGLASAFDANTGEHLWTSEMIQFGVDTGVISSAMVHNGVHVVATFGPDGGARARPGYALIDAATGETLYKQMTLPEVDWEAGHAGGGMWGTPVFDTANDWMYNGTANPYSAKREHRYDNAILKFDVDRDRTSFGHILDHYKGSSDGFIGAYESNPVCQHPQLGADGSVIEPRCFHFDLDFVSPIAFRNSKGELLVGSIQRDGRFHVAHAATMAKEWTTMVSHLDVVGNEAAAAGDAENVYVATNRGPVFALDNDDGHIKWVSWVPSVESYGPLSLAGGVLFVPGNETGVLTALDASDGTPLWATQLNVDGTEGTGDPACPLIGGGVSIAGGYVIASCDSHYTIAYAIDPNASPIPLGGSPVATSNGISGGMRWIG